MKRFDLRTLIMSRKRNVSRRMNSVNRDHKHLMLEKEYSIEKRYMGLMRLILIVFIVVSSTVVYKVVDLNQDKSGILFDKIARRYRLREFLPGLRGQIRDRNGYLLAESLKAYGVRVHIKTFEKASQGDIELLGRLLEIAPEKLQKIQLNETKKSIYLKRQVGYETMKDLKKARIPGTSFELETKRFYLEGQNAAHVTGFVNIDGKGQEGVELMYDQNLKPEHGYRLVLRDRKGNVIREVGKPHLPKSGNTISLTIDKNIQQIAMRALQKVTRTYRAKSASALVVDTQTGEILAMANYPSYNPNSPKQRQGIGLRNRVVTDTFEPGSIIKPLVMSIALDAKVLGLYEKIDVEHGYYRYYRKNIKDVSHRHTLLTPAEIIKYSSNVGMTKISERLNAQQMWNTFDLLGFGRKPKDIFPGAVSGLLANPKKYPWKPIEKATRAYGYGVSVSLLQMAQAYTSLARDGEMVQLSLLKDYSLGPNKTARVFSEKTARRVLNMLEEAVGYDDGSKLQDQVPYYRIGGKSGTAKQSTKGKKGYQEDKYRASFVLVGPISKPRVVVAVTILEPDPKKGYYGGKVAAPVAAEIMNDTMRILAVVPDRDPDAEAEKRAKARKHKQSR